MRLSSIITASVETSMNIVCYDLDKESLDFYCKIFEAIVAKDGALAEKYMREHLNAILKYAYSMYMEEQQ